VTTNPPDAVPAEQLGHVHFVGIGGAGMSGIARIMLARGLPVSGSDAKDTVSLAALRALGATIHVGHAAGYVDGADTVVISTAIRATNPEVLEAERRGLRVIHRAGALASVMLGRRAVAVAGTHGKTTTTSLLTVAIQHCGADPSFAIGGNLNESGANAHNGSGDVFVAEADESDGSFLLYAPTVAVVTNVEPDHLDHYGTPEAVAAAFDAFVDRIRPGGFLVTCADDSGARLLAEAARSRRIDVRTYGESADADLRLVDVRTRGMVSSYEPVARGRRLGTVRLRLPGRHNVLNSAAALEVGLGLGFPLDRLREGLASFTGTRRRFELKGTAGGVRVYDSYAHHPTELAADLAAARDVADGGRVIVVFQPHLYSRTQYFADQFGASLGLADEVVVMDVYAAREDPVPGVTGALVAAAVPLGPEHVVYEPSWSAVAGHLADRARPGDLVLTCGAGDVTMIGPEVLARLAAAQRSSQEAGS
jgi:UDP-N-acetylmuramate--alanine ligase